MKQNTYTWKVVSPDGVLHSIGTITFEGNLVVHRERRTLDSEEELSRRVKAISERCVIKK